MNDAELRGLLARLLVWEDAHAPFERAVQDLPATLRGARPDGSPYSPWQLLEHLRFTQRDILEFCRDPSYHEPHWPDDYWPASPEPPGEGAWDDSVAAFLADRAELARMAGDPEIQLEAMIPHGDGQTYIRELLLIADHNAYHIGEMVLLRRMLGAWPPS